MKSRFAGFHSIHQFLVKWHSRPLTGPITLIFQPEIDIGSKFHLLAQGCRPPFAENDPLDHFPSAAGPGDVHAAACGLLMNGPAGPFILSQGFCLLGFSSKNYCMSSFTERTKQKAIG